MVINIGLLKDKCFDLVEKEIKSIKDACGDKVKNIILMSKHETENFRRNKDIMMML